MISSIFAIIGTFFSSIWKLILRGFSWFVALPNSAKMLLVLGVSVGLNLFQCSRSVSVKAARKEATAAAELVCTQNNQVADQKAIAIVEHRQSIWDLFVENAKKDNERMSDKLKTDFRKVQVKHEQIVRDHPLPTDCKLHPDVVHNANQAISDATAGTLQYRELR